MRLHILSFSAALVLAATAASAQTVITVGVGQAHDCFIYAKVGTKLDLGVRVCTSALENDLLGTHDRAGTYDNRGAILDMLGRTNEASDDFNKAIAIDPNLGEPYINLGAMLIKEGRHQEALEQINKGLDMGLGFPHIGYYNRAVAEQMLGRYREAYFDYKKVLEIEPDFQMASERLKDFTVTRAPAKAPS